MQAIYTQISQHFHLHPSFSSTTTKMPELPTLVHQPTTMTNLPLTTLSTSYTACAVVSTLIDFIAVIAFTSLPTFSTLLLYFWPPYSMPLSIKVISLLLTVLLTISTVAPSISIVLHSI